MKIIQKVPNKALKAGFPPVQFRAQKLFADNDKDKVANVFDSKPNNRKKQ